MAQPPPDLKRATQMAKGQIRGRIRTGAKTATKEQEREFLERFRQLGEDPSPLVPVWKGAGADPFKKLRSRLAKVSAARGKPRRLKWLARKDRLDNAYAQTLLVLHAGKIPSLASMRFRKREVKFVFRGRGQRDKLIAVHNAHQDDVRLLGYLDIVRKHKVVLVSIGDTFEAYAEGDAIDPKLMDRVLADAPVSFQLRDDAYTCPHMGASSMGITYQAPQIQATFRVCRECVKKLDGHMGNVIETHLLAPGGRVELDERPVGWPWRLRPEAAVDDLARLAEFAADDALERRKEHEGHDESDLLQWYEEALVARLEKRDTGYVLADDELWLGAYDEAARTYAESPIERRVLEAALLHGAPRVRVADPSPAKILEPLWDRVAQAALGEASDHALDESILRDLVGQRPSEALTGLERALAAHERFRDYPRYESLPPSLALAHDLVRANRTGDDTRFQKRLRESLEDDKLRPLAYAFAKAFEQDRSVQWQVAPHEKDRALYYEPFAQALALADPAGYPDAMTRLADAVDEDPPAPRKRPS